MLPIILPQKIFHKKLFGTQNAVAATCESSGPACTLHISIFAREALTLSNVLYLDTESTVVYRSI